MQVKDPSPMLLGFALDKRTKKVYLRRTERRMKSPQRVGDELSSTTAPSSNAPCLTAPKSNLITPGMGALKRRTPSGEAALRTVKSLEVLSDSDRSSGISADTIAHKSEHATKENNNATTVERWASITRSKTLFYTHFAMCARYFFIQRLPQCRERSHFQDLTALPASRAQGTLGSPA